MIAHFVGGPLNGKERALGSSQNAVEVYELQQPTRLERIEARGSDDDLPEPTIQTCKGEYRRVGVVGQSTSFPSGLPVIYVWVDERPFRFVVTVDAYPGADATAARELVKTYVSHAEHSNAAFIAGIREIRVEG